MAKTMAQALAGRIRYQVESGAKVLEAAGPQSTAVFGNPADVLSVVGNVSDVAHTNHLWLLDMAAAGVVTGGLGDLEKTRPASVEAAVAFLAPRDTDDVQKANAHLKKVNEAIAARVENLSDDKLEASVNVTFYGDKTLRDLLFIVIEHGSLHIGQAWGILKGKGLA